MGRAQPETPGFGRALREYRLAAGLTQDALAQRAMLSVRGIADLERGVRRFPYEDTVERLAAALHLTTTEHAALRASGRRAGVRTLVTPLRDDGSLHNLPIQPTRLIGREREIQRVRQQLLEPDVRLLTLTGAGGSGKTRVALAVAAVLLNTFKDGVWLVELAALQDPALVPGAIARSMNLRDQPGRSRLDRLLDALRPSSALLVLDNCEHLVDSCAALADEVLRACNGVRILATSREPLRLAGERTWRVPTLPQPVPSHLPDLEELASYAAVQLFVERAQAVQHGFLLNVQNSAAVAGICARLDGLPLAIELAAAQVRVLAPEQILNRLDDAFHLLVGGSRSAPTRQQTLRATLDWSYLLLGSVERHVFERLAVFAGGCDLEIAEAVCGGDRELRAEVLNALTGLVDKSLVMAQAHGGAMRYRLLETVRAYAALRLADSGEEEATRRRHAEAYVALAERAESELRTKQVAWFNRLDQDYDNVRAALLWLLEQGEGDLAARLGGALWFYWFVRGRYNEGRGWLDRVLSLSPLPTVPLAKALNGAGSLAWALGDFDDAKAYHGQALELQRRLSDQPGMALSLRGMGNVAHRQNDYGRAAGLIRQALVLQRHSGDTWGVAASLNNLGDVARLQGNYARAVTLYRRSLILRQELGDTWGVALSLSNLGLVAQKQGDIERAVELLEEAIRLERALGATPVVASSLADLGIAAQSRRDYDQATAFFEESLALGRQAGQASDISRALQNLGYVALLRGNCQRGAPLLRQALELQVKHADKAGIAGTLEALAGVATAEKLPARVARLLGAAAALRDAGGIHPLFVPLAEYDRYVVTARAVIGEAAFAEESAAGRALPLKQAIQEALLPIEQVR